MRGFSKNISQKSSKLPSNQNFSLRLTELWHHAKICSNVEAFNVMVYMLVKATGVQTKT